MSLTSSTLLVVFLLGTALMFAAAIWLWPRLARQGWRRVLGRVGLVLAVQVLMLSSIGIAANRSLLIYGSWTELAGQEKAARADGEDVAGGSAVKVIGRQRPDVPGGGKRQVAGEIEKVMVQGQKSRIATPAYVYLPPEYFKKGNEKKKFPAAIVLTGFPGTAENLLKGLRYPKTAWTLAKQKKTQPMILVMMRPTVAPPRNTQCVDIPDGPLTETFFGTDLPQAISGAYRVGTSPRNWGIIGDSTGGYCALKVALQHPESYAAGVGLSADYEPEIDRDSGDLFHGNTNEKKRSDLLWSLDHLPQGNSSFLVTTSLQGESNYKATRKFIEKVRHPARVSSITLDHGGHNFNTWNREIPPALEWMSRRLGAE
ncbi:alpha/beta hydrolase-fold protein [Streptomyces sp. APSN-46.1]|uniref:alpha/beta hydrolase n=1 Tax=Streptomyces sp. APSN-46.1 TaxID=2929049 RepID=UPI001FB26285|nr:alpha/beta hydrolase-fold protein [Streptomyces sp. APSN-46.1]MCJ1676669.1 alpha/beta hydrolase-fold protein [Streptomyces sp. APSN-46.1]